ncbi:hypothetical protein B0H11DRAFT_2235117 [Mycena galericulata]|nr:hypothetical protein B0H11DRAFT_2235117 [Mycena galericulata]
MSWHQSINALQRILNAHFSGVPARKQCETRGRFYPLLGPGFRFCIKGSVIWRANSETRSSRAHNIRNKIATQLSQRIDQNIDMSAIILIQYAPSTPVPPVSLAEAIWVTTSTTSFSEPATPFSALQQFESINDNDSADPCSSP